MKKNWKWDEWKIEFIIYDTFDFLGILLKKICNKQSGDTELWYKEEEKRKEEDETYSLFLKKETNEKKKNSV